MNDTALSWTLTYRCRPWTINDERSGGSRGKGGHFGRARLTTEWREQYSTLCQLEHVPPLRWIDVVVLQLCRDNRRPDIAACVPAVKAAIDGIVDAGVIPDDCDPYVHGLHFVPPAVMGYDALTLRVSGPVCANGDRKDREKAMERKLLRQAGFR